MEIAGKRSLIISHGGKHGRVSFLLLFFLLATAAAQSDSPPYNNTSYARFSPSMAVIVVVLISALFFMGFFSIYIRHCSDSSGAAGTIGRALSQRRRAAAARGLEQSVLETFPTFSYSEVKDHKIGKGGLECAVCLNEFDDNETLRLLPKCDHVFHAECIDAWLESHVTCPVCRANLSILSGDEETAADPTETANTAVQRTGSTNEEIVIQVENDNQQPGGVANRSSEHPIRPPRTWSIRRPKMFSLAKYRSHSTGHSLVQPVEALDRFTLKLPAEVRKEVIDRAMLNRTRSMAVSTLQREGSSRTGYRTGGGEGSSRAGRSYRRIEVPASRSDRWVFFTRMLSMKSPRVGAETGEGSKGGSKSPVKLPSFKCLEPKADGDDEGHLFSGESVRPPV